jgi:hypothetical protein
VSFTSRSTSFFHFSSSTTDQPGIATRPPHNDNRGLAGLVKGKGTSLRPSRFLCKKLKAPLTNRNPRFPPRSLFCFDQTSRTSQFTSSLLKHVPIPSLCCVITDFFESKRSIIQKDTFCQMAGKFLSRDKTKLKGNAISSLSYLWSAHSSYCFQIFTSKCRGYLESYGK